MTFSRAIGQTENSSNVTGENALSLPNRELFWKVRFLQQSGFAEHLPFLFWLMSELQPQLAVTTGVDSGVAHFATCQTADKLGLDTACHGFGQWSGDKDGDGVPEALTDYGFENYEEISFLHNDTLSGAAEQFSEASVDLLNVGEALSEEVLDTVERKWMSRLSEQGVILLRDVRQGSGKKDTRKRLAALRQAHPHFEFDHGGGLLMLLVGDKVNDRLQHLARASRRSPGYRNVQNMFRRLGAYYGKELTARDASQRSKTATAATRKAEAEVETLQKRLAELEAAYDTRHKMVATLQARLHDEQERLETALAQQEHAQRAEHEERIASLECDLQQARAAKEAAEAALARQTEKTDQLTHAATEQKAEDDRRRAEDASRTAELEARLNEIRQALADRDTRLAALASENGALVQERDSLQANLTSRGEENADLARKLQDRDDEAARQKQAADAALAEKEKDLADLARKLDDQQAREDKRAAEDADRIAAQEARLAEISEAMGTRDARIASLATESDRLVQERDRLQADMDIRFTEIAALTRRLEDQEREFADRKQSADAALAKKQEELADLTSAVKERDDRIAAMAAERDRLVQDHDREAARQKKAANAALAEKEKELADLTRRLDEQKARDKKRAAEDAGKIAAQQAALEKASQANGERDARIAALVAEQGRLVQRRDELQAAVKARFGEIAVLTQRLKECEAYIEEVRVSTSWRVSAPVRVVGRVLRRRR
ncbi:hypothetical protein JHW45_16940 [Paracoccus stylophorae]|uniref:Chromosome partition protein Smc n=1 Tax=Paracoccus stylophorae TaxID=659350 RepID=A0ABY7SUH5_9RHOB|nr:hypothetical protein [Paracoccus stylophorae]WCR10697.1 hypothetical protein JHW45_16940 [Paracoccus stylophorae]